ncbi:MAG: ATP-binding protein, partial [Chloroflexi bacterium]|nr:ATP-binding protein [Chloroflexota bacterium]
REANEELQELVKIQPKHSILHYNLALTYAQLGDMVNAQSHYHLADASSDLMQRRTFRDSLRTFLGPEAWMLDDDTVPAWPTLLRYLTTMASDESRLVIALDEFQYLVQSEPAFPSLLQKLWDTEWERRNLLLILCGSHEGMVHDAVLSYDSPLYGRRTGQIRLQPFSFSDYWRVFDQLSFNAAVENYTVSGGVPRYITALGLDSDLWDRVRTQILNPNAVLYDEPRFVLSAERADALSYFAILRTIAGGEHRRSRIAASLGQPASQLAPYLERLIELALLERRVPITRPDSSRLGLYYLADPFFRFWFRFVLPNQSAIELRQVDPVLARIQTSFGAHVSLQFEDCCANWLYDQATIGRLPFTLDRVGRWWNRAGGTDEIDVLGVNEETGDAVFGECKWSRQPIGMDTLTSLYGRAQRMPWRKDNRREWFVLFSRSGFQEPLLERARRQGNVGYHDILLVHDGHVFGGPDQ